MHSEKLSPRFLILYLYAIYIYDEHMCYSNSLKHEQISSLNRVGCLISIPYATSKPFFGLVQLLALDTANHGDPAQWCVQLFRTSLILLCGSLYPVLLDYNFAQPLSRSGVPVFITKHRTQQHWYWMVSLLPRLNNSGNETIGQSGLCCTMTVVTRVPFISARSYIPAGKLSKGVH